MISMGFGFVLYTDNAITMIMNAGKVNIYEAVQLNLLKSIEYQPERVYRFLDFLILCAQGETVIKSDNDEDIVLEKFFTIEINDDVLIGIHRNEGIRYLTGFSILNKKYIWKIETKLGEGFEWKYKSFLILNGQEGDQVGLYKENIYKLNTNNGDITRLKKADFSKEDQYKIICIYKDQIILVLNKKAIIAIDINSGEVVWEITELYNEDNSLSEEFVSQIVYYAGLNEKENVIEILMASLHLTIFLEDKKYQIQNNYWAKEPRFRFYNTTFKFDEGLAFFTADVNGGIKRNIYGAYDLKEKEVKWYKELPMPNGAFLCNPPVVNDYFLFIQDSKNDLYVINRSEEGI